MEKREQGKISRILGKYSKILENKLSTTLKEIFTHSSYKILNFLKIYEGEIFETFQEILERFLKNRNILKQF